MRKHLKVKIPQALEAQGISSCHTLEVLVAWYLSCTHTLATCHCTGYDRVLVACSEIDIDARVELPGRDDG